MKFLIKTASLLCSILLLTSTAQAQNFLGWSDYSDSCTGKATVTMSPTDYYGSPALLVTATLNGQPAIVNTVAPGNGYLSNNQNWTYGSYGAIIGYGSGFGYGNMPETDEVTCYFYFADGSSCKSICIVEIDF